MESLTDAYFASALDICGFGNGRGVSGEMRNDGFGETPWTDFVFDAAYWCDACSRDTPFEEKNMCREQVSRKWQVNGQLTHSFGRKSLCRGRCGGDRP